MILRRYLLMKTCSLFIFTRWNVQDSDAYSKKTVFTLELNILTLIALPMILDFHNLSIAHYYFLSLLTSRCSVSCAFILFMKTRILLIIFPVSLCVSDDPRTCLYRSKIGGIQPCRRAAFLLHVRRSWLLKQAKTSCFAEMRYCRREIFAAVEQAADQFWELRTKGVCRNFRDSRIARCSYRPAGMTRP